MENKTSYADRFEHKTLAELMRDAIALFPDRNLYGVKKNGSYQWIKYSEFDVRMRKLRAIFKKEGMKHGDRIAIIAGNSVEFALTVYAAYGLGGIIVPMYEVQKEQDWKFIFEDSSPILAVVRNNDIREKVESFSSPSLKRVFVIQEEDSLYAQSLNGLIDDETEMAEIDERLVESDVSDIIYTSGTTGRPRGVELTHRNIVNDFTVAARNVPFYSTDVSLSFLPWAHAFGKIVELHLMPFCGAAIALAESPRTVSQNLLEIHPTILVSVPKIFNKIYDIVHLKVEHKAIARLLLQRTEAIAIKNQSKKLSFIERLQKPVLDKLVAKKVRDAFGGQIRFCLSGGASLSPAVASFFMGCGVTVYEGYGMTEHSPVIAVNTPADTRIGTVGKPLPGVHVDIIHQEDFNTDDDTCGEIVISSDSVMKGYYNDPEATAAVFDEQGRFHTGDMGYLDKDGFLHITGRVKEQYKLENGKYVVPTVLEEKLNTSLIIAQSVIFGSGKAYNVALINPTPESVEKFKTDHHIKTNDNRELAENNEFRSLYAKELETMCADFRGYEKPQRFALILDEFTIQNGLLTPALKIKRREIEKRYADVLTSLYQ